MKKIRSAFKLPLLLSLCSFTSSSTEVPDSFVKANQFTTNYSGSISVGKEYQFDMGRRNAGIIGQYLKFELKEYKKYDASIQNGFVYSYNPNFINKQAIKDYTLTFEVTYSQEFSYSYSHETTWDISNKITEELDLPVVKVTNSTEISFSDSVQETYTFAFGQTETIKEEYTFDASQVPDGYVFTPCFICSAEEFVYDYCIYNDYWISDVPSTLPSENVEDGRLLKYDESSFFLTIGIKKEGASGGPEYYLSTYSK